MPYGAAVRVVRIESGEETILGRTGMWKYVEFGKSKGWAFGPFLSADAQTPRIVVQHDYAFSEPDYNEARAARAAVQHSKGAVTVAVECPWANSPSSDGHCGTLTVATSGSRSNLRFSLKAGEGNHHTWRAAAETVLASGPIVFSTRCKIETVPMGPLCEKSGCKPFTREEPCTLIVKYIGPECRAAGSPTGQYALHAEIVSPSFRN